jgi:DNA-binding HxlR family transcriptional regulator
MSATTNFSAMHCSIARAFAVMGDPWKALIIRDLSLGLKRFDQLAEDLGISRKVLTGRLSEMVADGLIERVAYQNNPPRFDYVLTEKGNDLFPIVLAAMAWGDRWLSDPIGVPAMPLHKGHECCAKVICGTCRKPIKTADITGKVGPSGKPGPGTQLIGTRMRQ